MAQAPPCPHCGSTSYQLEERRWLTCTACGKEFDVQTDVCRACGRLNTAKAATCAYCQAQLPRDPVSQLIESRAKGQRDWVREHTARGVQQKTEEERASRERMESYWAEEHARREAAARAALRQRTRQRKMLIIVGLISVILVLCLIGAAVALSRWASQPVVWAPAGSWAVVATAWRRDR